MTATELRSVLESALDGRRLLDHPFYRRWESGEVELSELAEYAEQYRHFESALPAILESVVALLPEGPARSLTEANLADETSVPRPHVELLEDFAARAGARGAGGSEAGGAVGSLLDTYRRALGRGPGAALGAIAAYELQSADIASTKADGLRRHYGFDSVGTRFWDVHAEMDRTHAEWVVEALREVCGDRDVDIVVDAARDAAGAWWAFLDEREASRPLAA